MFDQPILTVAQAQSELDAIHAEYESLKARHQELENELQGVREKMRACYGFGGGEVAAAKRALDRAKQAESDMSLPRVVWASSDIAHWVVDKVTANRIYARKFAEDPDGKFADKQIFMAHNGKALRKWSSSRIDIEKTLGKKLEPVT